MAGIQYKIVRSTRKTVALFVGVDGQVLVKAPRYVTRAQIQAFVDEKASWIIEKQEEQLRRSPKPHAFVSGELFLYRGFLYPLEIVSHNSPALVFNGHSFQMAKSAHPRARELFTGWYRRQARSLLVQRVNEVAARHGLSYTKIRISSARTRWGSCSSKGTLSFTWRLIMAPPEIINYVIVHELAHLIHKNHSKQFWAQVAAMMPDYRIRADWLKQHGRELAII